jgi:crotonobetaine/carnitine-CoA ligase
MPRHAPDDAAISPSAGYDIAALIEERGRQRGLHPFIVWAPFDGPEEIWSYARFADTAARLAGGLAARGVTAGDRVLVHLENCPEALLARFACAWLGAICVGTNALAAGPELAHFAEATGAVAAITQPKLAAMLAQHAPGLGWIAVTATDAGAPPAPGAAPAAADSFDSLIREKLPRRAPDPMAPSSIMFTTGTTSRAKAVVWTHANVLWAARLGALQQALRADDVAQIFLPLYHVVGLTWSFMPMLWIGGTVVLQPRFSGSRFWPAALRHRATLAAQVGFTAVALRRQEVPREHFFRQWTVSHHDARNLARFGVASCIGAYGMTELVAPVIVGDPWSQPRPGSLGRPSLGYRIRIVDDSGAPVAPGGTGRVLVGGVRGLSIFLEYDRNAAANEEAFDADGFFRTGDIATLHEDGWIQFVDRAKDLIKVGGEGVASSEVEAVIRATTGVREVAVVGKPDPVYGEIVAAFVELDPDADPAIITARILEDCRAALAKFKVPREVVVVAELPRIGNNKIQKEKLRERLKP